MALKALLGQAFSVGKATYGWDDVVLAAEFSGDWARLRETVRQGIACLRRMDQEEEDSLEAEELETAANEFRYSRDLVSAEEMEAWLGRWGLTAEGWMDYVRSSLLRQKWSGRLADCVAQYSPSEQEVDERIATEAVCSGGLARWARVLAGRAAIHAREEKEKPEGTEPTRAQEKLARLEASFRRFRERTLTPEAVRAQIRSCRTDWTRLDCQRVSFPEEGMAREAALCVREDGRALAEVASDADREIASEQVYLEEMEPDIRADFFGAKRGALLGPVRRGDEFVLYLVLDKVLPSEDDAATVARAEEAILQSIVAREIDDRVKWHSQP
jgi:hypothetical protein